jgi:cob(I)alamin adenosyltransferase
MAETTDKSDLGGTTTNLHEYRRQISSLQTSNNRKNQRIAELETEITQLRSLRKAVNTYLDILMIGEPAEKHLAVIRHLARMAERPNKEAFKRRYMVRVSLSR